MTKTEILKLLRDGNLIIGNDVVKKMLKVGKISKVFLAKNCSDEMRSEITYYKKLSTFDIEECEMTNEELGELCKKPFSISVLGVTKK